MDRNRILHCLSPSGHFSHSYGSRPKSIVNYARRFPPALVCQSESMALLNPYPHRHSIQFNLHRRYGTPHAAYCWAHRESFCCHSTPADCSNRRRVWTTISNIWRILSGDCSDHVPVLPRVRHELRGRPTSSGRATSNDAALPCRTSVCSFRCAATDRFGMRYSRSMRWNCPDASAICDWASTLCWCCSSRVHFVSAVPLNWPVRTPCGGESNGKMWIFVVQHRGDRYSLSAHDAASWHFSSKRNRCVRIVATVAPGFACTKSCFPSQTARNVAQFVDCLRTLHCWDKRSATVGCSSTTIPIWL